MGGSGYIFARLTSTDTEAKVQVVKDSIVITEDREDTYKTLEKQLRPGQVVAEWRFTPDEQFEGIGLHNVGQYMWTHEPRALFVRTGWEELLRVSNSEAITDYIVI